MKKGISVILWILLGVLVFGIAAFSIYSYFSQNQPTQVQQSNQTENAENIDIYFIDQSSTSLKAEKLSVKTQVVSERAKLAAEAILAGPLTADCKRVIPEGTKLIGLEVTGETTHVATVNLTSEYYGGNSVSDIMADYSIVKTLCSIKGIDGVEIKVEGKGAVGPSGNPLGVLSLDDVVFDNPAANKSTVVLTLYFSDSDAMYLHKEMRTVEVTDKEPIEKFVVDALIAGPADKSLLATLPSGTKLKSIETKNGTCFVNLSGAFANNAGMGSSGEQMAIYSITNSLTELTHIQKVQILVDGQKSLGHFDISEPFERDQSLIK